MGRKERRKRRQIVRRLRYPAFIAVSLALIALLWPAEWPLLPMFSAPQESRIEKTVTPKASPTGKPTKTPAPSPTPTPVPTPTPMPAPTPVYLTVSAAGDCTLGGDPRNGGKKAFDKVFRDQGEDFGYFFRSVLPHFEADDITIVNLEGTLTTSTNDRGAKFCFRGDPSYVNILTAGSVEACNLANNHTADFHSAGFSDTKRVLDENGIVHFGYDEVDTITVKGLRVGFCGFTKWTMSRDQIKRAIETLRAECDIVIASFHWGEEGHGTASKAQIDAGRFAVDAGADLVLGHHPHVVQGIEKYKGKYIVYSLGNFCFGGNQNPKDKDTFIFQQTFIVEDGEVSNGGISVIPCRLSSVNSKNDYQPTPAGGDAGEKILRKIENLSKGFPEPAQLR